MNKVTHALNGFLLLALLMGLSSCAFFPQPLVFDMQAFETAQSQWEEQNLTDYQFEYYSVGWDYHHVLVQVDNGAIVQETALENSQINSIGDTIDDLFFGILASYHNASEAPRTLMDVHVREIIVSYDPDYHFPTRVVFDYHVPDGVTMDGNFGYRVLNFEVSQ